MTYRLTITAPAFQHILQQTTTTSQRPFIYPAGLSRVQDSLEFLLHTTPGSLRSLNHSSVSVVGCNILSNDVLRTLVREESLPRSREHPGVLLVVGHRAAAGYLGGICLEGGDVKPLAAVHVLGPGLLQVRLLAQVP